MDRCTRDLGSAPRRRPAVAFALAALAAVTPVRAVAAPAAAPVAAAGPRFWALVVGIGEYHAGDRGIPNLDFAAPDARAVAAALREPSFGVRGIPPERLRVLLDRDASRAAIRAGLQDFIARAAREDVVIVFFAGHGAPDPHRPADLYLLAHDSEPGRLPATAIPMAEVADALRRVRADRVLVLADACHSAGIMPAGIRFRSVVDQNPVNRMLADLARVRRNRLVVTSSAADERSMEGTRWRHGVFTWALLRGLRGAADATGNRDGVVQLGELVSYVRDTVERETLRRQHPVVGGDYDGRLPLALAQAGAAAAAAADDAAPPDDGDAPITFRPPLDLGEVVLEPRVMKPLAFAVLPRRAIDLAAPRAERAQLPAEARRLDAWLAARRAASRAAQARGAALRALDERRRRRAAGGGAAGAAAREAAARRERDREVVRRDRPLQAAEQREAAARRLLLRALEQRLAARAGAVPGSFWLAAVQAELDDDAARYFAALEAYHQRMAAPHPPLDVAEPRRELGPAARLLDRFLDLHRRHPARADALYLRAWLAQEASGEAAEVAGHCLRAVAEHPDHPFGAELYLRMADGYFDGSDRVLGLAREAYLAALARAPRGAPLRETILFKLGWALFRQGDLPAARERFVQQLAETAAPGLSQLGPEARSFLAAITAELGDATALEGAALPAALRAEILAAAAGAAAADTDDAHAAAWWERALAVDPVHPQAPEWDAAAARSLLALGRRAEATARRAARFQRFGPNSAWYRRHGRARSPEFLPGLAAEAARAAAPAPAATPPSTRTVARAYLWRRLGALRRCHEAELRRNPRAAGRVALELQWNDRGLVNAVHVASSTLGSPGELQCLRRAVRRGVLLDVPAGAAALRIKFTAY